jgi:hypothetical protein
MTDDMMHLKTLVEKAPDADLLRDMISFAATRLMELEVGAAAKSAWGVQAQRRRMNRVAQHRPGPRASGRYSPPKSLAGLRRRDRDDARLA